jgi:hypothetical protein
MDYHVSDSDKLFKLLSNSLLPQTNSFGNTYVCINKMRRIISLYYRNSSDPFIKSFGCILPDNMERLCTISYEDCNMIKKMLNSLIFIHQCNPPIAKIRYIVDVNEVIK